METNLVFLIYTGANKPLVTKFKNRIELLNEYVLCSTTFFMVQFAKREKAEIDNEYGWVTLAILGVMLVVNLLIILWQCVLGLFLISKKYYNRLAKCLCKDKDDEQNINLVKVRKDFNYFKSHTTFDGKSFNFVDTEQKNLKDDPSLQENSIPFDNS